MANNSKHRSEIARQMLRHSAKLGAFAVVAALLLGLVYELSRERISQQEQEAERRALFQVLPPTLHNNDLLEDAFLLGVQPSEFSNLSLLDLSEARNAYVARVNSVVTGVILPVEANDAYSGNMQLLVGINADGSVSGVRVISHRETPGLGDKVELRVSDWILAFNGQSLVEPLPVQWQVKKDGGEFDQFVGATITPRAVVTAVKNALLFFSENRNELLK